MTDLVVLILAGGKSRRMGQDKALLRIDGETLLERTVAIASQLSHEVWISTPWRDEYQSCLSEKVQWLDDVQQEGPVIALSQSLQKMLRREWVLVLACDLPYLDQKQLKQWIVALEMVPKDCVAALVKQEKWYEPLCGFYRCSAQTSLEEFIENGDRSFQKWLATEQVFELELDDPSMLFNCNTPKDFATLKAPS